MEKEIGYVFKIVLLGDHGVGKTSLMKRIVEGTFSLDGSRPILGVDFSVKTIEDHVANIRTKFLLFDLFHYFPGPRYTYYLKGTKGIYLLFDLSQKHTFEAVEHWLEIVQKHLPEGAVTFLVGNKADLEHREIAPEDIQKFTKTKNMKYYEVSAKTGQNVEKLDFEMARILVKLFEKFKGMLSPRFLFGNSCPFCGGFNLIAGYEEQVSIERIFCVNCDNTIQ